MAEQQQQQSQEARVLNLTPHALHIYCRSSQQAEEQPVVIPSDGDLRLESMTPTSSLSHIHPLHYFRASDAVEAALPVVHAQVFVGLDEKSPGFKHIISLTERDAVIVSMPVAHWLATKTTCLFRVLSPGTGPTTVVRFGDEEPTRRGQIKGVRALEFHSHCEKQ